jgi:hypothetical protein
LSARDALGVSGSVLHRLPPLADAARDPGSTADGGVSGAMSDNKRQLRMRHFHAT